MPKCTGDRIEFGRLGRRVIEADFSGGDLSSDGGMMLLKQVDERIGLTRSERSARSGAHRALDARVAGTAHLRVVLRS